MRAYFIGNMYLSSIQQGIQAAHCLAEMFVKYSPGFSADPGGEFLQLDKWAREHKTMVLLNGGFSSALHELFLFMEDEQNPYPYAKFHEGQDALDAALTCVGIVLPAKIYEGAKAMRKRMEPAEYIDWDNNGILHIKIDGTMARYVFTDWEKELMSRLNCMRLAQ